MMPFIARPARPLRFTRRVPQVVDGSSRQLGLRATGSTVLDRAIVATIAAFAAVAVVSPALQLSAYLPRVDLAVDSVAAIVTPAVVLLAWARFRELRDQVGLFIAGACLVLIVAELNTLFQRLVDEASDVLAMPVIQTSSYVGSVAQLLVGGLLVGGLLVAGGSAALQRRSFRFPLLVVLVPAASLLVLLAVVQLIEPLLPALVFPSTTQGPTPGQDALVLPRATTLGALVQLALGTIFAVAAILSRRLYQRRGWAGDAFMTVAALFAAFAEGSAAFASGISPRYLTETDVLRLAFLLALFLGLATDARRALRTLRKANTTLEQGRDDDFVRAGREERSRLSREFHDGLAQDLWLAKLKIGRLRALPDIGPDAIALSDEVGAAIDAGLAEARQAVMALRVPGEGSFPELLGRYVDDFSDTFGLSADFSCDADIPPLEPAVEAELMRIAQESLNNARRHADASRVLVSVRTGPGQLRLTIADDGTGFDSTAVPRGAYGLAGMRERASLIGGEIRIESRPNGGTIVLMDLPLPGGVAQRADLGS